MRKMIECDDKVMFSSNKKMGSSYIEVFYSIIAATLVLRWDTNTLVSIRKKFKLKIN